VQPVAVGHLDDRGAQHGDAAAAGGGDLIEIVVNQRTFDADVELARSDRSRPRVGVGEEEVHQILAVGNRKRVAELRRGRLVGVLALEDVFGRLVLAPEQVDDPRDDASLAAPAQIARRSALRGAVAEVWR
jgi:hypothetical protein